MSIYKGYLEVSIFGESHGEMIGMTIHNFPCGKKIDIEAIERNLQLKGVFKIAKSKRAEPDKFKIVSGLFNGFTTGLPLTFIIENCDVDSSGYDYGKIRPSHADYAAYVKYAGYNDYRGGGHFSGRLMSLYIILGSLCEQQLQERGIKIVSKIASIGDIVDEEGIKETYDEGLAVNSKKIKEEMISLLKNLKGDSVGGIVETYVFNPPIGLGNPLFESVESQLSYLIFSIPGVKGIEFGDGFAITRKKGSEVADEMRIENGKVEFLHNHSGGIQGGITNGEVVYFRTAIKPTPTIAKPLKTIDIIKKENIILQSQGRHDGCIVPKAVYIVNAITQFAFYDMLLRDLHER